MAASPRCLFLVLTLWMIATRPSAVIPSGSPVSRWWGSKESARIQERVRKLIQAGKFDAVDASFQECKGDAARARDRVATIRCLIGQGGARMAAYDYRGALEIYLQAK